MNDQVVAVRDKSESLQEMLAALRTGNTPFDALAAMLDSLQVACKKLLLQARDQGTDILDQQAQHIPHSNPPRYHTSYDGSIHQQLTQLLGNWTRVVEGKRVTGR